MGMGGSYSRPQITRLHRQMKRCSTPSYGASHINDVTKGFFITARTAPDHADQHACRHAMQRWYAKAAPNNQGCNGGDVAALCSCKT